jgi:hypothetical protein
MYPEIADKINFDEALDLWADMEGAPPSLLRSDEELTARRAQRRALTQLMQQAHTE